MSAYSDWKHGIITDDQYRSACMMEEYMDRLLEERRESTLEEEEGGDEIDE